MRLDTSGYAPHTQGSSSSQSSGGRCSPGDDSRGGRIRYCPRQKISLAPLNRMEDIHKVPRALVRRASWVLS